MFQFLRRVSGSLLPRPDRPWRDDATSHAPTIGRKRRYSVTEQDIGDPTTKRVKNDLVRPDTECDSASEGESAKGDAVPPDEGQDVKEVTEGVKEVDLADKDETEDPSIRPEGVPLPDSPSGSPEPESSESSAPAESDGVDEHADDKHSITSSSPEADAEEGGRTEVPPITAPLADKTTLVATVELGLHDTLETLGVEA